MNNQEFKYLITQADYFTKYEPIIDVKTDEVYAFEALSKFEINQEIISTEDIFRKLHHNNELFFQLEKRNKTLQIDNYNEDKKLFVNFDADIVVTPEQQSYWDDFLSKYKKRIVVEITENGNDDESSAKIMRDFSKWLCKKGIETALDDFAQDGSMFSFYIMNRSQYIKIDKSFLKQIKFNMNFIPYLKGLLQTVRQNNQKAIIEGVETKEDYDFVKTLDCDYMQGYYFKQLTQIR
jgi:EAL domain-containing protein (putative c-di-GMP-specific phosphodiesterase class I)